MSLLECSGGNLATRIQTTTNLLCSNDQCTCKINHFDVCSEKKKSTNNSVSFPGFGRINYGTDNPFETNIRFTYIRDNFFNKPNRIQFIYFKDLINKLQDKLALSRKIGYSKFQKVLQGYDSLISHILIERDQLSDWISKQNIRLALSQDEVFILNMLKNSSMEFQSISIQQFQKVSKLYNVFPVDLITKQLMKFQHKLKQELSLLKSKWNDNLHRISTQILKDEWDLKRDQLFLKLISKDIYNFGIISLKLNNTVMNPIPQTFNLKQITHLHLKQINQQFLKILNTQSKHLKQLTIDKQLSFNQMKIISQGFQNIQKIDLSFKYKSQFKGGSICNFDCDFCSCQKRQQKKQHERIQQYRYLGMMINVFKKMNSNHPNLQSLTLIKLKKQITQCLTTFFTNKKIEFKYLLFNAEDNNFTFKQTQKLCQQNKQLQQLRLSNLQNHSQNQQNHSQDQSQNQNKNQSNQCSTVNSQFRIQNICKLNNLKTLEISKTLLLPQQIKKISQSFPSLIELNLNGNQDLGDQELVLISINMINLRHLQIQSCCITDQGLLALAVSKCQLSGLNIGQNDLTTEGIISLCQNQTHLKTLKIANIKNLSSMVVKTIQDKLTQIQTLNLFQNGSFSLCNNNTLTYLSKIKTLKTLNNNKLSRQNSVGFFKLWLNNKSFSIVDHMKISEQQNTTNRRDSFFNIQERSLQNIYKITLKNKQTVRYFRNIKLKTGFKVK